MNVLYSGFKGLMHSANGGYDKITHNDIRKTILYAEYQPFGRYYYTKVLYHIPRFILELKTRILRYRHDITHFFYGELTCINYLPYKKSLKHKTVITLHLDVEGNWNQNKFIRFLRTMDGIIVLSSQQQRLLFDKYGIHSCFIPHGFDKPSFIRRVPVDNRGVSINEHDINVCTIGKNYRDMETLEFVIKHSEPHIIFHLIGIGDNYKKRLRRYNNVRIYNRLSDDEYYSLIELCDYNFLPVTFATANNALLEAQALGTTSILPQIDGIRDYASEDNLFYKDIEGLSLIFENLSKNGKREELIKFSNRFNWMNIYSQLNKFYSDLFKV